MNQLEDIDEKQICFCLIGGGGGGGGGTEIALYNALVPLYYYAYFLAALSTLVIFLFYNFSVPGGPSARSGHRMVQCKKQLIVFGGFHDNTR